MTITENANMTAARLNAHLASGGVVQVTTWARSTLYNVKHAGWFSENIKGELYVTHKRGKVCLGSTTAPLVGIRLGREQIKPQA